MIEVFKKINVDFDYMKLRNDVNHVYHTIKEQAVDTQYEALAYRNICITASKPDSDDWTDGIAGKTYVNKTGAQGKQGVLTSQIGDDSNEMLDETKFVHPIKQIQGLYLEEFVKSFEDVYRWRISILPPRTTLSIHKDGSFLMQTLNTTGAILDWRLHFPIVTNNRCFLVNWPDNFGTPSDEGETVPLEMAHFKAGSSYLLNTSKIHCATNYSDSERIHLIASLSKDTIQTFQ